MIYWFSGTGNSEQIAVLLARLTNDKTVPIEKLNREGGASIPVTDEVIGVVFPVYAWGAPRIVTDFVKRLIIPKDAYCYAVCTCGDDAGNSIENIKKLIPLSLGYSVIMPNNYLPLGDVDSAETTKKKLDEAKKTAGEIADAVNKRQSVFQVHKGKNVLLKSTVINFAFNKFSMSAKPFYAEDSCTACGRCERECPVKNIRLSNGKPEWGKNCIQCMRCIHRCPVRAIQYGKHTKDRGRYTCPEL